MNKWRRRIRGAMGMGLTWAAAWFGAGMVLLAIVGLGAADVPFPLFFGLLGFLAGATFSVILGLTEGRRRFDEMSLPRFAGWGAVGGFLLAVAVAIAAGGGNPMEAILGLGSIFALAGAGSAAGSLALARKAEGRESLAAGVDGIGERLGGESLGQEEERERLGGGR